MRLYEIEQKSLTDIYGEGIEEFITRIKQECSEFLSYAEIIQSRQNLYRGIDPGWSKPGNFFSGESPTNRTPMSSSKLSQRMFDTGLELLGFEALRSNSIFVTADERQAKSYGDVYCIYPINGFSYTYTTEKDVVLGALALKNMIDLESFWKDVEPVIQKIKEELKADPSSFLSTMFDHVKSKEDLITLAFNLITGASGFGAMTKHFSPETEKQLDNITRHLHEYVDPKAIKDYYNPKKTNLEQAMAYGREILIHGKYHAIKMKDSYVQSRINDQLGIRQ